MCLCTNHRVKIPYKAWKHFHYRYVKQTQLCWIVSCIRNQVFNECIPVSGSPQAGAAVYSTSCCSLLHTRRFGMVNDHYYKLHGYWYGRNEVPWPYWSTNSCLSEGVVTREYQEIARIPQRWLKCQKCPTGGFLLHFCGSVASRASYRTWKFEACNYISEWCHYYEYTM